MSDGLRSSWCSPGTGTGTKTSLARVECYLTQEALSTGFAVPFDSPRSSSVAIAAYAGDEKLVITDRWALRRRIPVDVAPMAGRHKVLGFIVPMVAVQMIHD